MKIARVVAIMIVVLVVAFFIYLQWIGDKPREGAPILYLARVTESSDKAYQDAIKKAQDYETKGQIEAASREYVSATKINRFELPSYYPLLQSAKLNLSIGKREEGIQNLEHFIDNAREELHLAPTKRFMVQNATPEHEANLRTQLAEAEELLKKQKQHTTRPVER